jgi:hypothetical protein
MKNKNEYVLSTKDPLFAKHLLVTKVGSMAVVVAQRAIIRRGGGTYQDTSVIALFITHTHYLQDHFRTKVVATLFALIAHTTSHTRFESYAIAYLEICDTGAHRGNDPCRFMAQHHGFLDNKRAHTSTLPVMHITTTNACRLDVHQDLYTDSSVVCFLHLFSLPP